MNLIAASPLWLVLVLGCAMVAAAIEDAVRFRISNLTTVVVLVGAIAAALIVGLSWSLWQNLAVFAAILLLGTITFAAGWLGGGDVKLFAAAGLWFDFSSVLAFVAFVFLSGGLVAICYLLARPFRRAPSHGKKSRRIPYGIAIAVGALIMVVLGRGIIGPHKHSVSPLRNINLGA